jgi:mRNA-degrading endonuclease toxin of MazEF toxin-antitoxin module
MKRGDLYRMLTDYIGALPDAKMEFINAALCIALATG